MVNWLRDAENKPEKLFYNLPNSVFKADFVWEELVLSISISMESQSQISELRNNPENFHSCN